jgi:UDP-GlcNAc:undecaprenyl-phosphate/decaprenyl-phosphate GlcNAc-1-phosphate transferase
VEWRWWIGFLGAFALAGVVTPLVITLARKNGWVAQPRVDRWHTRPTALLGGIAIFGATMLPACLMLPWDQRLGGLAVAATGVFLLGLVDDLRRLSPPVKMMGQAVATCVLLATGTRGDFGGPALLSAALTVFWVIGITNAMNLLDNMDGLAAGVTTIAALTMFGYLVARGEAAHAVLALLLAGACLGFLIYNFSPARVFMGDCGSMFLGFVVSAVALAGTGRLASHTFLAMLVPVAVLAVPLFDTTLVTVVRRLNGRPVSQGGRDHTSHRLVALGLSERGTVLLLYAACALFGLFALLSQRLSLEVVMAMAGLMFLALAAFGFFLGMVQVYPVATPPASAGREGSDARRWTFIGGTLLNKQQMLLVAVDLILIPLSFLCANLLRFDGAIPRDIFQGMVESLPYLISAKALAMVFFQTYAGVWRYAGSAEVVGVLRASTAGSLLATLMLWRGLHFQDVSRSALIIDWMAFTALAIAARTGFVLFQSLFTTVSSPEMRRLVVVGANDIGVAAARQMRWPGVSAWSGRTIGFLDDDVAVWDRSVGGLPVLGPIQELPQVVQRTRADGVVIALPAWMESADRVVALCGQHGIPHVHWMGSFDRSIS